MVEIIETEAQRDERIRSEFTEYHLMLLGPGNHRIDPPMTRNEFEFGYRKVQPVHHSRDDRDAIIGAVIAERQRLKSADT